ncbi:lytic transglycosylase domain-containing protein [Paraburkholderia sp. Tr-20389]|uniref:transglycosylase SLT domain-containing protein n=1 Tax=Paraburkholderia sp. Tr-20389 TaxID=2703903 RepID=UPI001980FC76|nr:transglycosylase SLT domain-containing protein [Paraburkholderia sp. Tr-20389]MBN3754314.1 lytic transglycosylase domain-containing protein [Paraburkholderia sp. Tr-20389]
MTNRFAAALVLALACASSRAAVIETVISPNSFVVEDGGQRTMLAFTGTPVYACGLQRFLAWAKPLIGQRVEPTNNGVASVVVDGATESLQSLLVRSGWLQPAVLDDQAQAALTERRGGWACASAQAPFDVLRATVDAKILAGIALNESAYNGHAWPWTLNVAGRGFFFRTREDTYKAIRFLISDGRCDFDIGLMQVNWCYHRQRFASPWDALAPATNVRVAEDILNENYRKTNSAVKAVAYYHSANPQPGREYLARFIRHLSQIDRGL